MKQHKNLFIGLLAAVAMLTVILDAKTALTTSQDVVMLCISTVIPSLFPFFVLSGLISACLLGRKIPLLRPLGRLCKIPTGSESLLLLGFLSGYPVGAQLINQACRDGRLSHTTGRRMLGFCSNAGPAFLFGMLSPFFADSTVLWVLWGIHIVSALIVSWLLPGNVITHYQTQKAPVTTLPEALQNAIKSMAAVCGWVVLFRVLIGFCERWFLWLFPTEIQVLLSGITELSNRCILLQRLPQAGMRFILASVMLSFGGICVAMQTISVTQGIGTGLYFPGKILQTLLSAVFSISLQYSLFGGADAVAVPSFIPIFCIIAIGLTVYFIRRKKVVAFEKKLLYNSRNEQSKGAKYAVSEENDPRLQLLPAGNGYGG